jgi:hypothetical protein
MPRKTSMSDGPFHQLLVLRRPVRGIAQLVKSINANFVEVAAFIHTRCFTD